jgi:hypothetical protein
MDDVLTQHADVAGRRRAGAGRVDPAVASAPFTRRQRRSRSDVAQRQSLSSGPKDATDRAPRGVALTLHYPWHGDKGAKGGFAMSSPVALHRGIRQQRQVILDYIDDAYSAAGMLVPGGLGQFYQAVDRVISSDGESRDHVARMAVSLRTLNDMLRRQPGDEQEVTRLRSDLYDTARTWIASSPSFHSDQAAA